jgi:hypothetical protein
VTTEQAPVAQRIEHLTTDQKVGGSNPFGRTMQTSGSERFRLLRVLLRAVGMEPDENVLPASGRSE